jgi:hypothetical protein
MANQLPAFLGGPQQPSMPRLALYQQQTQLPPPPPAYQRDGMAILGTASTALGVASVAYPPVLPVAATVAGVQALDAQLGYPVTKLVGGIADGLVTGVGFVADGVVSVGKGIGDFFGGLFGGRRR